MTTFDLLRPTRENILRIVESASPEALDFVPAQLNNNLLWNAGHVVATMELLTYGLAGLPLPSGRAFVDRYRKGTRPEGAATPGEVEGVRSKLLDSVDRLAADLDLLDWSNFKPYATSYGVTLKNLGEALTFNNMHEAMHLGTMISLRRLAP